jgi:hypothetical protein
MYIKANAILFKPDCKIITVTLTKEKFNINFIGIVN